MLDSYLPRTNRWLILASSVPVSLSCGTLFVYSVYGTQLAEKCLLDSSLAANLNISATVGTSVGGLIGGIITDRYGTQIPVLCSLVFITLGYKWLHALYDHGPEAQKWELILAMFFVGVGSVASYFAAIKAVTVSFPTYKGSAQSVTIASFAISSLLYSFIYAHIFDGNVGKFLQFLSVSSGVMQFVGAVFIRVDGHKNTEEVKARPINLQNLGLGPIEEQLPLILRDPSFTDLESVNDDKPRHSLQHLNFKDTVTHPVFWIHFLIMAVFQGLGQMYIYSVGYIIKAIHYHYTHSPNAGSAPSLHKLQALHVSIIAVCSFAGRLASGPFADMLVHKFHCQRHWVLVMGACVMFVGHFALSFPFDTWSDLMSTINLLLLLISCLIGFAYGLSFTTFPGILSDLFSMKHYSLLWGIIYSSTVPGLTVFTKIFGYVYDKNSQKVGDDLICTKGSFCYLGTFELTSTLALLAFLSILTYIYVRRTQGSDS